MTFSSIDIINILKSPITPYPYKFLFYPQEQKFGIYPYCEVVKTSSESNTTDITKLSKDVTFEIRLYIKYTRRAEFEEIDREEIEKIITDTLEAYDFLPTQKIYFESKIWSHRVIDNEIRGSISTLRFKYTEVLSTSGSGIVGSSAIFEFNSQTTPTQIKVLSYTFEDGTDIDKHAQDDGAEQYDPSNSDLGIIRITYENTVATDTLIRSLAAAKEENNGKFIRTGISTNYTVLVGDTVRSNDYGNIEKATTALYLQSTW